MDVAFGDVAVLGVRLNGLGGLSNPNKAVIPHLSQGIQPLQLLSLGVLGVLCPCCQAV